MRRTLMVTLLVTMVWSIEAIPAAQATTTRVPIACEESQLSSTDGNGWVDEDGVLHVRDWVGVYTLDCGSFGTGTLTATANYNLDLTTMTGNLWGTGVYGFGDGGFRGAWTATFLFQPDAIWAGRVLAHGFGSYEGYQLRESMVEVTHELVIDSGYVFVPGDKV